MAETGKKANSPAQVNMPGEGALSGSAVPGERPMGAQDEVALGGEYADEGPTVGKVSDSANLKVRPAWPVSSFTVDGIPEITFEGTMLTQAQLDKAQQHATDSEVSLNVEEVK